MPAIVIIVLWIIIKSIKIIYRNGKLDLKQEIINLLFLVSVLWIIGMTIFPIEIGIPHRYGPSNNFVPLSSIKDLMSHSYFMVPLRNIAGNIILFVPLGFMLPLKFNKFNSVLMVGLVGLLSSTFIELIQLWLPIRAIDVDDILLNTLGSMIGFLLLKTFKRIYQVSDKHKQEYSSTIRGVY
ncbi:VanZ family protein [Rossellomorea vietnamensis]|uniref:VanZ family protein n=1 Tax=Rossellomorea vietnamensis TaxID=218284 RepID=A0A5D4NU91_9BACI|nr:VanZ family protein [Rossellomorea vietnamensis]TYS17500.1 VanZ family protein [Rossellomorea vietnamensis]